MNYAKVYGAFASRIDHLTKDEFIKAIADQLGLSLAMAETRFTLSPKTELADGTPVNVVTAPVNEPDTFVVIEWRDGHDHVVLVRLDLEMYPRYMRQLVPVNTHDQGVIWLNQRHAESIRRFEAARRLAVSNPNRKQKVSAGYYLLFDGTALWSLTYDVMIAGPDKWMGRQDPGQAYTDPHPTLKSLLANLTGS